MYATRNGSNVEVPKPVAVGLAAETLGPVLEHDIVNHRSEPIHPHGLRGGGVRSSAFLTTSATTATITGVQVSRESAAVQCPAHLAGPRVLQRGQAASGRQPGRALAGPQAGAPNPSPAARLGRRGFRGGVMIVSVRFARTAMEGGNATCSRWTLPPGDVRDGLERTGGRTPLRGDTRSPIMSPDRGPRTEIRLGIRARVASIDGHNTVCGG